MVSKRALVVAKAKKIIGTAERVQKKNFSGCERFLGFIELMRPLEWSKSFFNMSIGLLIAFYVFNSEISLIVFGGGLAAVFLLWSGLYALNDWTDWKTDLIHKSKHIRAIPSGRVKPREAFWFSVFLIAASFFAGLVAGNLVFVFCLLVMLVNQFAYTLKPVRLKDRKILDIISGAFVNPVCRYLAGLFLFVSLGEIFSAGFPILPVLFVVGIQVGSYLIYRFSSKEHDALLKRRTTAASISEHRAKVFSRFMILVAAFSGLALVGGWYFYKSVWLGFIPAHYIVALIPGIFVFPMIKQIIKKPSNVTDPSSYKWVYSIFHIASDVVILGVLIIFIFFPLV